MCERVDARVVAERLEDDRFALEAGCAYMKRLERGCGGFFCEAVAGLAELREFNDVLAMEGAVGDESAQGVALPKRAV